MDDGFNRGQALDNRSHAVLAKIDAAEKAAALAKAEEERIAAKAAAAQAAAEKASSEKKHNNAGNGEEVEVADKAKSGGNR